ncbi:MAG: hypothetical protein AAF741_17675 [Bacteroidota bacterium]
MIISTICPACEKEVIVPSSAKTRVDLEREKGQNLSLNCQSCGKMFSRHVNRVYAKVNQKKVLLGSLISLGLSLLFMIFIGWIILIGGFSVGAILAAQEQSAVKTFNGFLIRRT